MESSELVHALVGLPDAAFLEVLRATFEGRPQSPEPSSYYRAKFFLGTASSSLKDDAETSAADADDWEAWKVAAVAYEDTLDASATIPTFARFGSCAGCGFAVRAQRARVVCPICERRLTLR